jgi:hypothetical protein
MCTTPSCMHLATLVWQRTVWVWDIWTFRPISLVFSSIPKDHYSWRDSCLHVLRFAEPVVKHLEQEGLEFLQFAFRWLNCLLVREVQLSKCSHFRDPST